MYVTNCVVCRPGRVQAAITVLSRLSTTGRDINVRKQAKLAVVVVTGSFAFRPLRNPQTASSILVL
jgi:hypothetical protein